MLNPRGRPLVPQCTEFIFQEGGSLSRTVLVMPQPISFSSYLLCSLLVFFGLVFCFHTLKFQQYIHHLFCFTHTYIYIYIYALRLTLQETKQLSFLYTYIAALRTVIQPALEETNQTKTIRANAEEDNLTCWKKGQDVNCTCDTGMPYTFK